jgi:putative addiction module component (TIGR02574 family)
MDISIPLNKMTINEKLRAIEEIWEDLLRDSENVPSPAWHADVLSAREQRIRDGKSHFSDWNEAKSRIRKKA